MNGYFCFGGEGGVVFLDGVLEGDCVALEAAEEVDCWESGGGGGGVRLG